MLRPSLGGNAQGGLPHIRCGTRVTTRRKAGTPRWKLLVDGLEGVLGPPHLTLPTVAGPVADKIAVAIVEIFGPADHDSTFLGLTKAHPLPQSKNKAVHGFLLFHLVLLRLKHLASIDDFAERLKVRLNLASITKISVATSSASPFKFIGQLPDFALGSADEFIAKPIDKA